MDVICDVFNWNANTSMGREEYYTMKGDWAALELSQYDEETYNWKAPLIDEFMEIHGCTFRMPKYRTAVRRGISRIRGLDETETPIFEAQSGMEDTPQIFVTSPKAITPNLQHMVNLARDIKSQEKQASDLQLAEIKSHGGDPGREWRKVIDQWVLDGKPTPSFRCASNTNYFEGFHRMFNFQDGYIFEMYYDSSTNKIVSVIIDTLENVAEFMGITPGDYYEYPFYSHRFCANLEKTPENYEWEIRHRYDFLGRMAVRSLQIRFRLKNSNAPLQMFYGS
jgi:hypothetical protein